MARMPRLTATFARTVPTVVLHRPRPPNSATADDEQRLRTGRQAMTSAATGLATPGSTRLRPPLAPAPRLPVHAVANLIRTRPTRLTKLLQTTSRLLEGEPPPTLTTCRRAQEQAPPGASLPLGRLARTAA